MRLLLIEDDPSLQQLTALRLRKRGHKVLVAGTGPDGIAAAHHEHPDAILCDIGLPGMDGYQATTADFDHHLQKPVDLKALDTLLAARTRRTRPEVR